MLSLVSIYQLQSTHEDHHAAHFSIAIVQQLEMILSDSMASAQYSRPYSTHIERRILHPNAEERLSLDGSDRYRVWVQTLHGHYATTDSEESFRHNK